MEDGPVGKVIARARHRKGWTQHQLSTHLGVAKSTVARWEIGVHYPQRHLVALEAILAITLTSDPGETTP